MYLVNDKRLPRLHATGLNQPRSGNLQLIHLCQDMELVNTAAVDFAQWSSIWT